MASYDDKDITEYIASLEVEKDSPESNILNQLLLVEDSLFTRTMYAFMDGSLTFTQFDTIPEVNDATIKILLASIGENEVQVKRDIIRSNLEANGLLEFRKNLVNDFTLFGSSVYSTIMNYTVPVSVSPDGSADAKYVSFSALQEDYLSKVIESEHVSPLVAALNSTELAAINAHIDFSQTHVALLPIQTRLSFVQTVYEDMSYLQLQHPIGFVVRSLFKSSHISLSIFDKVVNDIIDTSVELGDEQGLGLPGFLVLLSKYDWSQLNTSTHSNYTEIFNTIVILRHILPQFFASFEDISEFLNVSNESATYNAVITYFEAVKNLSDVIHTEMNRYLT